MKYELWLDESGEFRDDNKKSPSIVGGILIQKDVINNIQDTDYPIRDHAHANSEEWFEKYSPNKIQEILEHLSALKNRGKAKNAVRWVIAQNSGRELSYSSKSLYLRLLINCVYDLYIYLCNEADIQPDDFDNAPELKVYAAAKLDVDLKNNRTLLEWEDYLAYRDIKIAEIAIHDNHSKYYNLLINKIYWEKDKDLLDANPKHENPNKHLWFADYVCNFWFNKENWLKQDLYKKGEYIDVKDCFENVSSNCIEIHLRENDYVYEIEKKCKGNDLAAAILEYSSLLTLNDETLLKTDKEAIELAINRAFENNCYRDNKKSIKTLMQQCEEIEGKAYNYDECFVKLKKVSNIIKSLSKNKNIDAPFDLILFKINILCADCWLRTGQFKAAEAYTKACDREIYDTKKKYPPEMEFQYYEKMGLANIDYFKYDAAIANMEAAEKLFIKDGKDDLYYGEYYGDALCMHLLALMPKIRLIDSDKEKKDAIKKYQRYSDIALDQYVHYESELERHRQYRSFIELESPSPRYIDNALEWLIESKCGKRYGNNFHLDNMNLSEELDSFFSILNKNESEDTIRWYLLYYVLILEKAKSTNNNYADIMFDKLITWKEYKVLGISSISKDGITLNFYSDSDRKNKKIPPKRHPIPTIYWKMAKYFQGRYYLEINKTNNAPTKKDKGVKKKSSSAKTATATTLLNTIRILYSRALNHFIETIPIRRIAIEADREAFEYSLSHNIQEVESFINTARQDLEDLINKENPLYKKTDLPVIMLNTLNNDSLDSVEKLNKLAYLVAY